MKQTPQEILKDFGITEETKHHSYDYLYKAMIKAMEIYAEQPSGCKRTAQCDDNPTFGYCSHCGGTF